MRIVFLDFDGVLNTYTSLFLSTFAKGDHRFVSQAGANPTAVQAVEWLLEKCDAHVVVSSSWRVGLTIEGLKDVLEFDFGSKIIADRVIDKTKNPDLREVRGHQIKYWLDYTAKESNIIVDKYVIIDDDSDMLKKQMSHFVQTNLASGFTIQDCEKAATILGFTFDDLTRTPVPPDVRRESLPSS